MNEVLAITLQSMQLDMAKVDRVAANLGNAQTTGYRREVITSAGAFSQQLAAVSPSGRIPAAPAFATHVDQRAGTLRVTGQSLDVALTGPGWFEVLTETGPAYTRQGDFRLDAQGRVVNQLGHAVMGQAGEIVLQHGQPVIDAQGRVFEGALPGGASAAIGAQPLAQLKIVRFEEHAAMERRGNGLYTIRGEILPAADAATEVRQGHLENSNVSSMQEMVQLIQALRHFESIQRTAVGYDEMLGTAIRKLGDIA